MTSRSYDVILSVNSATNFQTGNIIIGSSTATVGTIVAVDTANNTLKVRLADSTKEFYPSETIRSNSILVTGTANGALNTTSLPFQANVMSGNTTTASTTINSILPSTFIAEKNAFTQNPVVRLYSIYYPGEWYPPNEQGNPTNSGSGRAWPNGFPLHFAEIVGDFAQDLSYNIVHAGTTYIPFPTNISGFEQSSDGKINDLTLTVYNVDNLISMLVEDPYISGNNIANSVMGIVNSELVHGLDPRTVDAEPGALGVIGSSAYESLTKARNDGLVFDQAIVDYYGRANASFNKTTTLEVGGTWQPQKLDTRDLSGGVVEIKSTFANFLDFWPEYSLVESANSNVISMKNSTVYRVGDIINRSNTIYANATIQKIEGNNLHLNTTMSKHKPITDFTTELRSIVLTNPTRLFILGGDNDKISRFSLTGADVETAVFHSELDLSVYDTIPTGLAFSNTGLKMYVSGREKSNIYQFALSSAYDVTTATFESNLYINSLESQVSGLTFDEFGANLYITGISSDSVHMYNLATPWNTGTATYSRSVAIAEDGLPQEVLFRPTGSIMYILGKGTDTIYQYDLQESWNIATATVSRSLWIGNYDTNITSLDFMGNGQRMLIGGSDTNVIYEIPLTNSWNVDSSDPATITTNEPLYIVNSQSDPDSYIKDTYKIDQLEGLSDHVATFGLTSWLQYFKIVTPKRKYYKNTCQWVYKGEECQYPGPGSLEIPGTDPVLYSNINPLAANNQISALPAGDICGKSLAACQLRNNYIHFGGFIGTGRTVLQG